jgi:hypothetical protein
MVGQGVHSLDGLARHMNTRCFNVSDVQLAGHLAPVRARV